MAKKKTKQAAATHPNNSPSNEDSADDGGVGVLKQALKTFGLNYGKDEGKREKWQALCSDCGVEPGASITKCKKALKGAHVNIWDLIRARETNQLPPKRFPSTWKLQEDLRLNPERRFPLKRLKKDQENKLLRALLVTL